MTREEAIQILKILKEDYWDDDGYGHETKEYDDTMLALGMAIEALEQEPCEGAIKYFNTIYELSQTLGVSYDFIDEKIKEIIQTLKDKALKQEPCVDAISRQAFEDAIEKAQYSRDFCKEHHIDYSISMEMVRIVLHDLPPVKPAEKVGQWID